MKAKCSNCGAEQRKQSGWWNLNGYYGLWGYFCGPCYNKVSHDSYGEPEQPGEYIAILLKQHKDPA